MSGGRGKPVRAPSARAADATALQLAARRSPTADVRPSSRPSGARTALAARRDRQPTREGTGGEAPRRAWSRLGRLLVRHREIVPLPVVAAAAIASDARGAAALVAGAALLAAGLALRLAASAALARDRRRLATWGAYAWLRHPHDLGTALAWSGVAIAAGVAALLPAVVLALAMVLGIAARSEERALALRFGEDFARWHRRTPGWIPRKPVASLAAGVDGASALSAEGRALAGFATLLLAVMLGTLAR